MTGTVPAAVSAGGASASSGAACRLAENDAVTAFLTRRGTPGALVIEGEAGIGKSTLWGAGVTEAMRRGDVVLSVRPAQSEARMSFAGLADLLEPVADSLLPRLEVPQRTALEVALLRRVPAGAPPNEREIGAAVLAMLRVLAVDSVVLLAIDDVQWLDRASAEVLAFALRRLRGESVSVLVTRRTADVAGPSASDHGGDAHVVVAALSGLSPSVIALGPLPDADVLQLVRSRFGMLPSSGDEREVVAAAGGNPFWALELGRTLQAAGSSRGSALPVPESMAILLAHKLALQGDDARAALLVVAALSRPTWGATRRGLDGTVADADAAIDAAVAADLITESAGRLRPTHPLLGSAALSAESPGQRHRLHRRLAEITADPEQRARHLALATDGEPDSEVARSLEVGASSARLRGATQTAAELAELAVTLTPLADRADLSRRRLAAAELRFSAGDLVRCCELAELIVHEGPSDSEWPSLLPLLVESTYWVRGQSAAQSLLHRVLDDPSASPRVRAVALACAADVGDGRGTSRGDLARESIALFDELGDTDPGALSTALVYLAEDHLDAGQGLSADLFDRAEAAEARHQLVHPHATPVLNRARSIRAYQLKLVDNLDDARVELMRALSVARSEGDDGSVPALLGHLALTECWAGRYAAALAAADEGLAATSENGGVAPASLYAARALLGVLTGDIVAARELVLGQLAGSNDRALSKKTVVYQHVLGLAALLRGDASDALEHLEQAWTAASSLGIREPGRRQRMEGDFGQALVTAGEFSRASDIAAEQRELGARLGRPTLVGVGYRIDGFALAAQGSLSEAVAALEVAVEAHRLSPLPLELPRSMLALGQVQRRMRAKVAARATLQAAVSGFAALGAASWQQVADDELRRLDGTRTGAKLTIAEDRVATLAAAGRNNKEIAAELFLSPRTVESHLATIYRKLAIRGRVDLANLG
jgi:DNA-binding CsgD family transcriptional regulator